MIRPATVADIGTLIDIENRCFVTDRLTRRNFRYILTKGNAETLIDIDDATGKARGYVMVFFNSSTSLARLYSFAVDPAFQGQGVGKALLTAAEEAAVNEDCVTMRLEIRKDNTRGIKIYTDAGYREFGEHSDYYEDHMDALRFEKRLVPHLSPAMVKVPFYRQTTEFTCGPSVLMMAMAALGIDVPFSRESEFRLWRESTTIFMASGHGGCDPYGLALAAYRRGIDVELYVTEEGALFMDSVRNPEKKEVMRIVQEDFLDQIRQTPIKLYRGTLSVENMQARFEEGVILLVLISSYRIYREKFPHWVVVTGFDERYIYVHDPYIDGVVNTSQEDCINMPILKKDFSRMARYGKAGQKAVIILSKPKQP